MQGLKRSRWIVPVFYQAHLWEQQVGLSDIPMSYLGMTGEGGGIECTAEADWGRERDGKIFSNCVLTLIFFDFVLWDEPTPMWKQ